MLLACITEIEATESPLRKTYDPRLLTNIKRLLTSQNPIRLSALTVAYLMEIRSAALPAVQKKFEKKVIVDAAADLLERELARIKFEIRQLEKERESKLSLVRQNLAKVKGGLTVHDFAERAVEMYCKHPELELSDILSLFSNYIFSFKHIPSEYKENVWTGSLCENCDENVYIRNVESFGRSGRSLSRFCQTCEEDFTNVERPIPFRKAVDQAFASSPLKEPLRTIRQKELNAMTYAEYLKTEEWAQIRRNAYAREGYRCRICGERKNLNVHHNHYPPLRGTEVAWDLCVLCEDCHETNHKALRRRRKFDQGFGKLNDVYKTSSS